MYIRVTGFYFKIDLIEKTIDTDLLNILLLHSILQLWEYHIGFGVSDWFTATVVRKETIYNLTLIFVFRINTWM